MVETERLIQKPDGAPKFKFSCRHFIVLPAILLLYISYSISKYNINEWTQHRCTLEYFENSSYTKAKHSCSEVNETLDEKDKHDKVQHDTSLWNLYYRLSEYIPLLLSTLLLPSLSDAYGRRILLVVSMSSVLLYLAVAAAVIYFNASPWYMVIISAVESSAGGHKGFICVVFAAVADITTSEQRVFGMVVMGTIEYISATLSSLLSGFLIETLSLGFLKTGLICTSSALLSFVTLLFTIQETLPKDRRTKMSIMGALVRPLKFYVSNEFKGKRLRYILLLLILSLCELLLSGRSELETIYLLGQPFCWGPANLSYYITARHATGSIIGIALLKPLMNCFSNEAITLLSIMSETGSYVIEGFAKSTLALYMGAVAGTLCYLAFPVIRGVMSSITSADKQGSILASATFVEAIGSLVGSLFSGTLYAKTVSVWPGLVFEGLACIGVINFIIMTTYLCLKSRQDDIDSTRIHEVVNVQ